MHDSHYLAPPTRTEVGWLRCQLGGGTLLLGGPALEHLFFYRVLLCLPPTGQENHRTDDGEGGDELCCSLLFGVTLLVNCRDCTISKGT
ncbi:unnamed protein product [Arctogadus glacialis]